MSLEDHNFLDIPHGVPPVGLLFFFCPMKACFGDRQEHPVVRALPRAVRQIPLHLPYVRPGRAARGFLAAMRHSRRNIYAAMPCGGGALRRSRRRVGHQGYHGRRSSGERFFLYFPRLHYFVTFLVVFLARLLRAGVRRARELLLWCYLGQPDLSRCRLGCVSSRGGG